MVANRVFVPFGQDVDAVFGSAADWVGDGKTLSDRLWLARKMDRDAIDRLLREGLMTGADPLQVARQLEDYLTPVGQKTTTRTPRSGKGNYAARTLARTETSHAFNAAAIDAAKFNPFVYGMRWLISGRHPKSDQCDQNAAGSSRGFPAGVYRFEDFPQIPSHPNCLCTAAPEAVDDDETVLAQLKAGMEQASEPLPALPQGRVDISGYNRTDAEAMKTAIDASGDRHDLRYSDAQRTSLKDYKASAFSAINRYLRDGITKAEHYALPTPTIAQHVENIDAAFARAQPTADVIRVNRGSFTNFLDLETQQVGDIYQDLGYMSTSAKTGGAGFGRELILDIYVPKGSKVLALDELGPSGETTGELEVLLPRGSAFVIRSIDAEARHVVMELLP
jgi:hypothetical protein